MTMTLAGSAGTSFEDMLCCEIVRITRECSRQAARCDNTRQKAWVLRIYDVRLVGMTQCSRLFSRGYVITV
jgi:hypothetical protein